MQRTAVAAAVDPGGDRPKRAKPAKLGDNIAALDAIRGVAVLLVLAHNLSPFDVTNSGASRALVLLFNPGWIGVQLFFVLSGFLISGILLDTRSSAGYLQAFYARRVLRIFPLYYFVLAFTFVFLPAIGALPAEMAKSSGNQIWLWTYLSNWTEGYRGGVYGFPHFWSLAVEEQFYLVWPLVIWFTPPGRLFVIASLLAIGSFTVRVAMRLHGTDPEVVYLLTISRIDALAIGAALAAALRVPALSAIVARPGHSLLLVAAALFGALAVATRGFPRTTMAEQTYGYLLLSVTFALVVAWAVVDEMRGRSALGDLLAPRWLRELGKYSYAIYVLHQPINLLFGRPWLRRHGFERTPIGVGLAVGLAYMAVLTAGSFLLALASYHLLEKRFLRLKRHFIAGAVPAA